MHLKVLYEDNHLLVVEKPAGLATMGVAEGEDSLLLRAKVYIKRKYDKPGNVYLGTVHRLDRLATGVCVLARTSKSAQRLSAAFAAHGVQKEYLALIAGRMTPANGRLENYLRKDPQRQRMVCCDQAQGKHAVLRYESVTSQKLPGARDVASLLRISLETGRKHQIRVQFAAHGRPLLGDRKYGSRLGFPAGIALHAHRLAFPHPIGAKPIAFQASLPAYWPIQKVT